MKCNLIEFSYIFMIISPKYFFERSKLLNETRISLNEYVFPLDKRVKHLLEFSDFCFRKSHSYTLHAIVHNIVATVFLEK